MQTRPFLKNLLSKVGKAFFRHPDQQGLTIIPVPIAPKMKGQKKRGGGSGMGRPTRRARNFSRWSWKKAFGGLAVPDNFA